MQPWAIQAQTVWDELRALAARLRWPGDPTRTIDLCARSRGLTWYAARASDTIAEYLQMDGRSLLRVHGFGRSKIHHLIEIVRLNLDPSIEAEAVAPQATMSERLQEWGIPRELPCDLIRLPTRIRNFCRENDVHRVVDLTAIWELMGWDGLLEQKNLGKRSVGEIASFCEALMSDDRESASAWLPIDPHHDGLSLSIGLKRTLEELEFHHREMLERRLVDGLTLEQSAEAFAMTRERVRQVEVIIVRRVSLLLEWFPDAKEAMLAGWLTGTDWSLPLGGIESHEDRRFLAAVIEAVFRELPQAVARSLEQQAMLDQLHEQLRRHPDLLVEGVDLDPFLQENVPEALRDGLCHSLNGCGRIKLDHRTGRVIHTDPRLREVVKAILAREDDAIPLTWLLELVRQTPSHPNVEREQIARYRVQWKSDDPSFPREKIIWDE